MTFQLSIASLKPAARRPYAESLYQAALNDPEAVAWRDVAEAFRACLPAVRTAPADKIPAWYGDYESGKKAERETIAVSFADGVTVRATMASNPGKAPNLGPALRTAIVFYRCRIFRAAGSPTVMRAVTFPGGQLSGPYEGREEMPAGLVHVTVPEIVSVMRVDDESTFDAGLCSALTAEHRAGSWNLADATARAESVPEPEGFHIYTPEEGLARWVRYQLQLDYSRSWLEASGQTLWFACPEDAYAAKAAREADSEAPAEDEPDAATIPATARRPLSRTMSRFMGSVAVPRYAVAGGR